MDVKRTTPPAYFFSLTALAWLSLGSQLIAEEVVVSDADAAGEEASSMIFISDDAASEPPAPPKFSRPQSATGSVVFVEDTPQQQTPAIQQPQPPGALPAITQIAPTAPRGEIKLLGHPAAPTNPAAQAALVASRPQPEQKPLTVMTQLPAVSELQIKPDENIQQVHAPAVRDQPGDIQIAVHTDSIPAAAAQPAPARKLDPAAELLITAHQLSQEAATDEDYTQIIQNCADALQLGVRGDQRSFARQLSSWSLNRRGQLRADQGAQELADADFQAALEFNPKNWRSLHNRGVSFAQAGQFAEAFDDFNAVIQLNPHYAKAYANRATLYVQAKDLQSALKDYQQAIQRDQEFATAYVGLGRVCHMLGRWEEALENLTQAVELDPTNANIICSRGDLHADRGLYGEALADYARTIELNPEFAHAYRNGAWLLATCPDERYRDPENAVLGARQALEYSYGEEHVALDTLAAALASNGQFEEAIDTITKAVDLAPEDVKFSYLSRLQLYQQSEPFRTEPAGDVSQVTYEASDQDQ